MDMKRFFLIISAILVVTISANSQERIKVMDGLYLATYGNTTVIEDEINQRTISMDVAQDGIDQKNGEKMYKVVCGQWTKRVAKFGLKAAVAAGIKAAGLSAGASLAVSAAAELASWIYDDTCERYGEKYK